MTIFSCMIPEMWTATDRIFCHSGLFFALLLPYGPRNQNFQRNGKNTWRYNHFTNISNSHMRYGSSNMKCNGQNFLSSGTVSCSFTPLTTQKMIILKKWKKSLEISSFYICVPKIMIRWCMIPEIWCATDGQADGWTDRQKDGRTDRRMNRWTDGQKKWHIEVGAS